MLACLKKAATPTWDTTLLIDFASYLDLSISGKLTAGTSALVGYNQALDTDPHRVVKTYNDGTATSAASYTIYTDGTSRTVATDTGVDTIPATNLSTIGAVVSAALAVTRPLNGSIKRMVVANTVWNAAPAGLVDAWLNRP